MSCIHYKFSSTRARYMVTFDGPSISLTNLRKQIMDRWRLKASRLQLQVNDAQSGEEYTDDEALIPTLTSLIVRRIPNVEGSGTAVKASSRQTQYGMESPKPVRTCKGIPLSFMVKTEAGAKGAMITSTGEYVIPVIDAQAYAKGKKERPPFVPYVQSSSEEESDPIPVDLLCPICNDLMTDAAIIPCCGNNYCDECIRDALLDSEEHICFTCKKSDVSPDSITANKALRQAVNNFKNGRGNNVPNTSTSVPPSTPKAFVQPAAPPATAAPPMLNPPWVAPGTEPPLVPLSSVLPQPPLSKEDFYRQRHHRQNNCSSFRRSHSRSRSRSNPRLSRTRPRPHFHGPSYPRSPYSRSNGPSRTRSPSPSRSYGHLCSGLQRSPPSYRGGAWEGAGEAGPYRSRSRSRSPRRSPVRKPPPCETIKTRTGDAPNSSSPKKENGKSSGMRPPRLKTPPLSHNLSSHHPSVDDGSRPRERDRGMASDRARDRISDTRKAEVTVEGNAARERSWRTERKERYQPSAGEEGWQTIRRNQARLLRREGRCQKGRLNLTALYLD